MYSALNTCLLLLFSTIFSETSSQLLPLTAGKNGLINARSHKTFENGVVSCGSTFCDAKKCMRKAGNYECTDEE